jgi:hypothetical protein
MDLYITQELFDVLVLALVLLFRNLKNTSALYNLFFWERVVEHAIRVWG